MEKKSNSKFALPIAIIVTICIVVVWMMMPGQEPIADTNGPDDFSLNTLTDEDILASSITATSGLRISTGSITLPGGWEISDGINFSASDFSGVYELLWADYILPSDFHLELNGFTVESGNLKMVVINNDKIIAVIEPGDQVECLIEDITGLTRVRIAAESASFSFTIPQNNYDLFEHN